MTREFRLPDVGEGVAEGEVVQWLVAVGDVVEEDQPIAEVETDKALVEIPSPVDGTVAGLHAEEGDVVPVGDVLVTFDVEGEGQDEGDGVGGGGVDAEAEGGVAVEAEDDVAAGAQGDVDGPAPDEEGADTTPAGAPGEAASAADADETSARDAPDVESTGATGTGGRSFAPPNVRRLARELDVALGSVAGSGPGGRVTEGDVRAAAGGERTVTESSAADSTGPASPTGPADRERTLAAPATRRLARELGVDLDAVPAVEERDGEAFVTEAAVREFAEAEGAVGAGTAPAAGGAPAAPGQRETREAYRGLRRTIGERVVESTSAIPHVHSFETIEVSRLVETRERLKPHAEEQGIHLTYVPLILKALVAALEEYPSLNATLDEDEGEIVYRHYHNVGIATHTEAGLMVPVVENVGEKGLLQLASEIEELARKARDRSISRGEMQGGTFTVTNYGAVGGEFGTPIINHPETAILGLGRIEERPVVEDGEVVARPTLPLSLGYDHRVIDGGTSAAFTNQLKEYLQEPATLLLE